MTRFDRRAEVTIGGKKSLIALSIRDLRITFEVKKDSTSTTPNSAKIEIYNLKPETRGYIHELTDEVTLRAGYAGEELAEVFRGDLVAVSHVRQGADVVTRLEASDGQNALRSAQANLSYAEGAKTKDILQAVVKAIGLPWNKDALGRFTDSEFLQGFAYSGPARDALDKVTARAGLEWSVQGGELKILELGGADNARVPLVTPESGLVGSPERVSQLKAENQTEAQKRPPGWRVTSLLLPQCEPGSRLGVQCAQIPRPTAYRVEVVTHHGDSYGGPWRTVAEVVDPGVPLAETVTLDLEPQGAIS